MKKETLKVFKILLSKESPLLKIHRLLRGLMKILRNLDSNNFKFNFNKKVLMNTKLSLSLISTKKMLISMMTKMNYVRLPIGKEPLKKSTLSSNGSTLMPSLTKLPRKKSLRSSRKTHFRTRITSLTRTCFIICSMTIDFAKEKASRQSQTISKPFTPNISATMMLKKPEKCSKSKILATCGLHR